MRYMLANEQKPGQSDHNGAARQRLSWRLLFLSAGELGLAGHMAEGRPGNPAWWTFQPMMAKFSAFERLHDQDGAAFSSRPPRRRRCMVPWAASGCNG